MTDLYDQTIDPNLLIRRVTIAANHLIDETQAKEQAQYVQIDLFTDYAALEKYKKEEAKMLSKERKLQKAMLSVKRISGKCNIKRQEPAGGSHFHRAKPTDRRP